MRLLCSLALISHFVLALSTRAADPDPHTDPNGDPLPKGAVARLGSMRFRQVNNATCVAFSPDGKLLATGSADGIVRLWDVGNGRKLHERTGHTGGVTAIRFIPGSKSYVASSHDGTMRLWDIDDSNKTEKLFQGHEGSVLCLAISSDGKTLYSGGLDRVVHIWDLATAEETGKLIGHRVQITGLDVSPDDKQLVTSSSDGTVRLWDLAAAKELRSFDVAKSGPPQRPVFSQDGKAIFGVTPFQGGLRSWDATTGKESRNCTTPPAVRTFALSPNSKYAAFAENEAYPTIGVKIKFVAVESGEEQHSVSVSAAMVNALAYSPDGKRIAAACSDSFVRIIDVATGKLVHGDVGHVGAITSLAFTPDGKHVISTASDRSLRLWEAPSGKQLISVDDIAIVPSDLALTEQARVLCTSNGKTVAAAELSALLGGEANPFQKRDFAAPPIGFVVPGAPTSATLAADGKLCAVSGNKQIRILNTASGEEAGRLPIEPASPGPVVRAGAMALDPTGRYLAARCSDGTLRLWDIAGRKECRQNTGIDMYGPVSFSSDGFSLLTADSQLRLWERASGQERWRYEIARVGGATSVAFSPDRRLVAVGHADGTISIRSLTSGKESTSIASDQGPVQSLRFSPDGERLASGGADSTILIWDVATQCKAAQRSDARLDDTELKTLWHDLADSDAGKAYLAIDRLAAGGGTVVDYIKANLKPPPPADAKTIAKLVADLDADDFNTREQATQTLEEIGDPAREPLDKALKGSPSSEFRTRAQQVLEHLKTGTATANLLRGLRAVELLDMIASKDAVAELDAISREDKAPTVAAEAKAALGRLRKK